VWKRWLYLAHRWIGVTLGTMVLVWFLSGIVMMYYDWPAYTDSVMLRQRVPFDPPDSLVGFAAAARAVGSAPVTGRLLQWPDRLVYQMWGEAAGRPVPGGLVDARSGAVLSPISPAAATAVATQRVPAGSPVVRVELLQRGDHYLMYRDYARQFPAYRVRFGDAAATAIYVSAQSGTAFGRATTRTRITTWLGTVPHWLYFQWLLQDREWLWILVSIGLPSVTVFIALTGITLGLVQLFPNRRRGLWRPTAYRGVSKWHHLAGVVFGLLVLTWTFTGILQNLGPGTSPRDGELESARGGPVSWDAIRLSERGALERLGGSVRPVAIDLVQLDGRPGYDVHLVDGREAWIDATTGATREELTAADAARTAGRIIGPGAAVAHVDRLARYDSYYYARHARERHLPVWRVTFDDGPQTMLYLDAVTGVPVGFADHEARVWRWARDAVHTFDYPALNNKRPWWDLVVLPLLLGGAMSAITGAWLLVRRVRRTL
jgi:hypothetical protein